MCMPLPHTEPLGVSVTAVTRVASNKENAQISNSMKWSIEETYNPYFYPCHEGIYSQGRFVYCALSVLVNIQPVLHIDPLSTCSRPWCDTIESHPIPPLPSLLLHSSH